MKLYDLPKGAKIKCGVSDGSKFIIFDHVDGMYSYCTTEKGGVVHPQNCAPIKKNNDGTYEFEK